MATDFANKAEATKAAKALVKQMGKGWEMRVWENIGWHAAVGKAPFSIYINRKPWYYSVMMSDAQDRCWIGTIHWPSVFHGQDPKKLVRKAQKAFMQYAECMLSMAVHTTKIVQQLNRT